MAELLQAKASLGLSAIDWTLFTLIDLHGSDLKILFINLLYDLLFCRFTRFGLVLLALLCMSNFV